MYKSLGVCVCVYMSEHALCVCVCVCMCVCVCVCVCVQGFRKACEKGFLTGHKVAGVRFVLEDGEFKETDLWPYWMRLFVDRFMETDLLADSRRLIYGQIQGDWFVDRFKGTDLWQISGDRFVRRFKETDLWTDSRRLICDRFQETDLLEDSRRLIYGQIQGDWFVTDSRRLICWQIQWDWVIDRFKETDLWQISWDWFVDIFDEIDLWPDWRWLLVDRLVVWCCSVIGLLIFSLTFSGTSPSMDNWLTPNQLPDVWRSTKVVKEVGTADFFCVIAKMKILVSIHLVDSYSAEDFLCIGTILLVCLWRCGVFWSSSICYLCWEDWERERRKRGRVCVCWCVCVRERVRVCVCVYVYVCVSMHTWALPHMYMYVHQGWSKKSLLMSSLCKYTGR